MKRQKIQTTKLADRIKHPLCLALVIFNSVISQEMVDQYLVLVSHLETHYGKREAVSRLKAYQNYVALRTMGFTPAPLSFHKTDTTGLPKILRPWKGLILNSDPIAKIAVNTVFGAVKALRLKATLKTETIEASYTGNSSSLDEFSEYIKQWKGVKELTYQQNHEFQLRSTSGPNGPAVFYCLKDLATLQTCKPLFEAVVALRRLTFPWAQVWISRMLVPSQDLHSKIIAISDKAGKSRPIAIADYWSQRALKPLHDALISHLKSLKTDCTYAHDIGRNQLKKLTKAELFIGTSDITAFTDRFPIEPQVQIISRCFGDNVSELWKQVIVERGFYSPEHDRFVYWKVGQPLGLYSSWATCVLTLHCLVEYRAHKAGFKRFRRYLILGDDVAIFDRKVYKEFISICEILGLDVNLDKSTVGTCGAEFAKQYFYKGHEVTGVSTDSLKGLKKDPAQILQIMKTLSNLNSSLHTYDVYAVLLIRCTAKYKRYLPLLSAPFRVTGIVPPKDTPERDNVFNWRLYSEYELDRAIKIAYDDLIVQQSVKFLDYIEKQRHVVRLSPMILEDHPLVYALSDLVFKYTDALDKLEETDLDLDRHTLQTLVFPPCGANYVPTNRRKTQTKSKMMLKVVRILKNGRLSIDEERRQSIEAFSFENAFTRSMIQSQS